APRSHRSRRRTKPACRRGIRQDSARPQFLRAGRTNRKPSQSSVELSVRVPATRTLAITPIFPIVIHSFERRTHERMKAISKQVQNRRSRPEPPDEDWDGIPRAFRSGGLLPPHWEALFGPLRTGRV